MQEEPANQGAWPFIALNLPEALAVRASRALRVRLPAGLGVPGGRLEQEAPAEQARPRRSASACVDATGAVAAERGRPRAVYFTDRGIEELEAAPRRRARSPSPGWPSGCATFVDLNPEFEIPVERLATWLARLDDDED